MLKQAASTVPTDKAHTKTASSEKSANTKTSSAWRSAGPRSSDGSETPYLLYWKR